METSDGGHQSLFSGSNTGGDSGGGRVVPYSKVLQQSHACMSLCMSAFVSSVSCQYRLSLVVEVCVAVESSGREPRRPGRDRQCSRFCSSLDTLLEKAVYIQGLVHEFRLASSIRIVKATPAEDKCTYTEMQEQT